MRRRSKGIDSPQISKGSVLEDLGFSPEEALEIRVKSEIYRCLLSYIQDRGFTQMELVKLLGLHQPDVSNLLTGRASKFSVGKLIKLAGKLNLGASISLIRPEEIASGSPGRKTRKQTFAAV